MKLAWIARQTSCALLRKAFPVRSPDTHKGDYGRVLLICGCTGYTGAPVLSANAALRSGSGLVYLAVPEKIYPIVAAKLDSAIVLPMPCDEEGRFSLHALPFILRLLSNMDACLLGPGLGRSHELDQFVAGILFACEVPLVLDADGLNAVSEHMDVLREAACPVILTPHEGEFSRLTDDHISDRVAGAMKLSADTRTVVVRKGHETIITDGTDVYLNHTGNPGMAVGGTGDVLAGMIVSILGRGVSPLEAAAAAVWLHGAAGDVSASKMGEYAMGPVDLIDALGDLLP